MAKVSHGSPSLRFFLQIISVSVPVLNNLLLFGFIYIFTDNTRLTLLKLHVEMLLVSFPGLWLWLNILR